jgi:hypothetical protein
VPRRPALLRDPAQTRTRRHVLPGCDLVFIGSLDEAEAGECLRDLLTAIRIFDSLGVIAKKAA